MDFATTIIATWSDYRVRPIANSHQALILVAEIIVMMPYHLFHCPSFAWIIVNYITVERDYDHQSCKFKMPVSPPSFASTWGCQMIAYIINAVWGHFLSIAVYTTHRSREYQTVRGWYGEFILCIAQDPFLISGSFCRRNTLFGVGRTPNWRGLLCVLSVCNNNNKKERNSQDFEQVVTLTYVQCPTKTPTR